MNVSAPVDLSAFPSQDGVALISPPQTFDGGEEAYDLHIGGALNADLLRSGRGAWQLASHHCERPVEALLEIGAGGGTCTLGLVEAASDAAVLVTDTSPAFLGIVRRKLAKAHLDASRVQYATLAGEELGRLPSARFDAVVIASALHHVGDWRRFLQEAADALRPGGVLLAQEPCREGNLMMAMVLDVALSGLWPRSARFSAQDAGKLERCRDSIYFLANSHVEKIGEDKHSFLVNEVIDAAGKAGFSRSSFYSNRHFSDLADADLSHTRGPCSILLYLDSFLEHHHLVSPDGMSKLRAHLFPLFPQLEQTFGRGDGAPLLGCFALRR